MAVQNVPSSHGHHPTRLARACALAALAASAAAQAPYTCLNSTMAAFPMCNSSLDYPTRVADLMQRLSALNESYKFALLSSWDGSAHVPQLAIPGYQWWNEALHGLGHSPGVHFHGKTTGATMFPEPSFTGCSFNTTLYHAIAAAIADDARGFNNAGNAGLTYWSPDVNPQVRKTNPLSLPHSRPLSLPHSRPHSRPRPRPHQRPRSTHPFTTPPNL
jgi:hypothetical protein